ncbi:hypothetical protein D3C77_528090 [compost metagenome]
MGKCSIRYGSKFEGEGSGRKEMITGATNAQAYVACYSYIENQQVQEAFCTLLGAVSVMQHYSCTPDGHGYMERSIGIFSAPDSRHLFSFVANQKSLLFYFRLPAVRSSKYSLEALFAEFDDVKGKPDGEWTVRLLSVDDVKCLLEILQLS